MSLASDITVLKRVPFFERFGDEHLRLLAFGGENQTYQADDVLFRVGDETEGGLVILTGQVRLTTREDEEEGERFKAGSLLGQRALLAPTKRRNNAFAVSRVEVMLIRRALFKRMLAEFPDLAAQLYAEMADELRTLTGRAAVVVSGREQL